MSERTLSDPLTLRLPVDVLESIQKIAEASDRTRSWVIVRALIIYLAGEGAEILALVKGREEEAAGDVHDVDDVLQEIARIACAPRDIGSQD